MDATTQRITPNQQTLDAIEEAKSGKLQNTPPIDLTSRETMFKSIGIQKRSTQQIHVIEATNSRLQK